MKSTGALAEYTAFWQSGNISESAYSHAMAQRKNCMRHTLFYFPLKQSIIRINGSGFGLAAGSGNRQLIIL